MNELSISFGNRTVSEKGTFRNVDMLFADEELHSPNIQLSIDAIHYVDGTKDVIVTVIEGAEKNSIEGACCFSMLQKKTNGVEKIQVFELFRENSQISIPDEVVIRNAFWNRGKSLEPLLSSQEIMCSATSEYVFGKVARELLDISKQIGDAFNHGIKYAQVDTDYLECCLFARDFNGNDHQIVVYGNTKITSFDELTSRIKSIVDCIPDSCKRSCDELCLIFSS